jgi:hypothetical protein
MAKLSSFKMDQERVESGVWHDWRQGIRFLVASSGSPEWRKAVRKQAWKRQRLGSPSEIDEQDLATTRKMAAQYLLLDWENVEDDDGHPLLFDRAYVMKLADDPAYTMMFDEIIVMANEVEAYREQAVEVAEGN